MFTITQAARLLQGAENILIVCHIRPDGDAAGSACALCLGLRALGKSAYIAPHPAVMARFEKYLAPYYAPADFSPEFITAVDTPGPGQYPPGLGHLAAVTDLAVDHHGSNSLYARASYIEPESASCGELVYLLLEALGLSPDAAMAEALYCALSTDTGCFRSRGTTGRCMAIAAKLRDIPGFDAYELSHRLFDVKSPARLRLEAAIYAAMEYPSPEISTIIVTRQMLQSCGVTEDDLDKISLLTTAAQGVRFGLMLRELEENEWKISVRTDGSVHAGEIAGVFPGGGGHPDSGGSTARGQARDILQTLLARLKKQIS